MAAENIQEQAAPASKSESKGDASVASTGMQKYLDKALGTLKKLGIGEREDVPQEMIKMLEELKDLDEPKVLAIANTIKHMSTFNALVRDNVENITVGNRYLDISQMFDSIRDDSKTLIRQLDDGKISTSERIQNWWMRMRRGTPSQRFEKIVDLYKDVSADTKNQLNREQAIMDGYIDFRFAVKGAEALARDLLAKQTGILEASKKKLADAQAACDAQSKEGKQVETRLELARDEAKDQMDKADSKYQLCKDIAENLSVGYDVGETLVTKLKQTHDVKDRVYRRAVTFFTTNEHVFTILGTVYTSQFGLNEVTQATEAMKEGANKAIEDVAELGRELERAALKAGYGSTLNPASVQKLVDAISNFQIESLSMIADLRKESEANAIEIRRVVEEGKRKFQETMARHARGETGSA